MRNYIRKYKKIIDKLIKKDFPRLKGRLIFLIESKIPNRIYSATTSYFLFFDLIIIHPKVRKYSKSSLKALFVHELAHLDLIANMNFFEKIKFAFIWTFTKKGKEQFERDADLLVIKKGYAKDRFQLEKESNKTYTKRQLEKRRKGYLSQEQIKSYIKKSKKCR